VRKVALIVVGVAVALPFAPSAQAVPFAYVTNFSDDSISQYELGVGGLLSPLIPATVAADGPFAVAVGPDAKDLYLTNQPSGNVSQYALSPTGQLTLKTTVGADRFPQGLALSPDGDSVYVTNVVSSNISQYDRSVGGALTVKTPATVAAPMHPEGVVVSPDGKSVYVANAGSPQNVVSQYDVGEGGALTPKTPPTVAAGDGPFGIAVSPNGDNVYVTNLLGAVSQVRRGRGRHARS
jgi:6-phosphogluconolactonase